MPDAIRAVESFRAHPQRGGFRAVVAAIATAAGTPLSFATAGAAEPSSTPTALSTLDAYLAALLALDRQEIAALALTLGILCFAVVTAILLVRTRRRLAEVELATHDDKIGSRAAIDRAYALLLSEPQILIAWSPDTDQPETIGDPTLVASADAPHRVLAFGTWLEPDVAQSMERSVDALRARGVSFAMTVTTQEGRVIEADGQVVGGRAILRLREVTGIKYELAELSARHQKQSDDTVALRALIEALPSPVWARDDAGQLVYVNQAYARAVEAKDGAEAVERGVELFDRAARTELFRAHEAARSYAGRLPAWWRAAAELRRAHRSDRARFSAGIGIDATEAETMRAELDAHGRRPPPHARSARDRRRHLRRRPGSRSTTRPTGRCGTSTPASSTRRRPIPRSSTSCAPRASCPSSAISAQWKPHLHEAYRAIEAKQHEWHLPDGRTLRVVTTPNPEGGVIYLFDDVTERLDLERRFDALIRVQGETLDNLAEAVAVFGSDGRLRLLNPAFARMWKLDPARWPNGPHIEAVMQLVPAASGDDPIWQAAARDRHRDRRPRRRSPAGSSDATATWSIAPPCRCPTARRWSRSRT